jgi:hypothetical protein
MMTQSSHNIARRQMIMIDDEHHQWKIGMDEERWTLERRRRRCRVRGKETDSEI